MIKIFPLLLSILLLNAVVFPQEETDLQKWGVKGKVYRINHYQSYDEMNPMESSASKILSYSSFFNRKGNISVQFEVVRPGADCYFKKTVYSYDRKNRNKETALYESERDPAFCAPSVSLFQDHQAENSSVKTILIEKTLSFYDRHGRLVRETVIDRNQAVVQENKYEYDARGENTRYIITQQKNRISGSSATFVQTIDFRTIYDRNGTAKETYRYENGKLIFKSIQQTDRRGRPRRGEQYRLETDARNNIVKATLVSLWITSYDGPREILDWTIYDNAGTISQQLYLLSENDEELLRLEYLPRKDSNPQNENVSERLTHYRFDDTDAQPINQRLKYILKFDQKADRADWEPSDFEARLYKFDARGNIVQSSFVRKENPVDKKFRRTIHERDVIYYP